MTKYAAQIRANAERILCLQRPSGQWSMRFDPKEPEVEFQTGHALWTLAVAGIPADQPQVQKAIQYLLHRQQPFGGWMDPLQSFENFKTPFRETQFAVLALSTYYPLAGRAKGWDSPAPQSLSAAPDRLLTELDALWERPSDAVLRQLEVAAQSNEALDPPGRRGGARQAGATGHRAAAGEASGRSEQTGAADRRVESAPGLRRASRHRRRDLLAALASPKRSHALGRYARLRPSFRHPGAPRRSSSPRSSASLADPVPAIRLQAIRGLWQVMVLEPRRSPARPDRRHAARRARPAAASVDRNQSCAPPSTIWPTRISATSTTTGSPCWASPRTATAPFKDAWRWNRSSPSSSPACWNTVPTRRRSSCWRPWPISRCAAATPTIWRRPPVRKSPPVYSRIGNDIEQIAFFGSSAAVLSRALLPLLDSPDAEMRMLARNASLIVRETAFAPVERAAGGRSESTLELARQLDADADAADVGARLPPAPAAQCRSHRHCPPPPRRRSTKPSSGPTSSPFCGKKGADGYACVNCHNTHTLFNATWSTVKNVIDRKRSREQPAAAQADLDRRIRGCRRRGRHCARRRPALAQRLSGVRDDPEVDQRPLAPNLPSPASYFSARCPTGGAGEPPGGVTLVVVVASLRARA